MVFKFDIHVGRTDHFCCADPASCLLFHQPGAGDVICMAMRIDCVQKLEIKFSNQSEIPSALLENRIDNNGLARTLISKEVRVRRRRVIEKLAEDHRKRLQS